MERPQRIAHVGAAIILACWLAVVLIEFLDSPRTFGDLFHAATRKNAILLAVVGLVFAIGVSSPDSERR